MWSPPKYVHILLSSIASTASPYPPGDFAIQTERRVFTLLKLTIDDLVSSSRAKGGAKKKEQKGRNNFSFLGGESSAYFSFYALP
ncbi:hypothetical protein NPIL_299271 [Nephila pilipes]|uniref:Uncharacterized protein n=1 Tax=Nephila pilipes TaxID=299642 RepID=A0A8X6MNM4_NEPPI|nr:hypothetical protein NPIL_299271 [Nephila pilipes]